MENDIHLNKIVFIASYMKSGNTWVRSIICSLLNQGNFKLSDLEKIKLFSQEKFFLNLPNIKYEKDGNINFNFVSNNWINAQQKICQKEKDRVIFFKTHNVRGIINNNFFTNESVCKGYIYLIRDPRDIVISYAKHMNISIDDSIDILIFKKNYMTNVLKVNEAVCRWKDHVASWVSFKAVPRLIMRYEDMIKDNLKTVREISEFLKIIFENKNLINEDVILNTVKNTNFSNLKKLEKKNGFVEATSGNFFRKGLSNQWKDVLTYSQKNKIEDELRNPMNELGYL